MNPLANLTPQQLRRAAEIKEQIQSLESELDGLFEGGAATPMSVVARPPQKRTMSANAKSKISASLKKRWAGRQGPKPKANGKMSSAAKAKISARMKEIWARRKAAKK
jgi:hypothetical protein